MDNERITKLRERVVRLKEKTKLLSEKIQGNGYATGTTKPTGTTMPAGTTKPEGTTIPAGKEKLPGQEAETNFLRTKLESAEHEKEGLTEKVAGLSEEGARLKEMVLSLEKEKRIIESERNTLSEQMAGLHQETWIKFSLDLIKEFIEELLRYFRDTMCMLKEAIDILDAIPGMDEATKKKVDVIARKVKCMIDVMIDAKEKYNFGELKLRRTNLGDIINTVISKYSMRLRQKISLNAKFSETQIIVNVDPDLITEMLGYIVSNSIESITTMGSIEMETRTTGDRVFLEIRDNGYGIPPHFLDKTLAPFFTLKDGKTDEFHTGLGLTRAYWICRLHGGDIELESQMNKGTKVTIWLPC
ncbi:MAG: sensor histidine kinase [Elusimicrobia bacterium]|nr:sensor histidine kinase [Elusimicrobiota bacterium]